MTDPGTADRSRPTVHVDTSLQIEQQKATRAARITRDIIRAYPFSSTSSYAKKEFKRAWLRDLALLYKQARGCAQIGDVYTKVRNSHWRPETRRRLERSMDAINAVLSRFPTDTLEAAVARLQAHLRIAILGAYTWWERSVTHQYDGTRCYRSNESPTVGADGSLDVVVRDCRASHIQCKVHEFFVVHRDEFLRVRDAIRKDTAASAELKRMADTIDLAAERPERLCDNDKCMRLGDALIAIDGLPADHYAANNDKEWGLLAGVLGKTLINPCRDSDAAKSA